MWVGLNWIDNEMFPQQYSPASRGTLREKIEKLVVYRFVSPLSFEEGLLPESKFGWMDTQEQKINISKSFIFPQNIECEKTLIMKQWRNISTPLRRNFQFLQPLSDRSSKIFESPHLSTTPYSWVRNDQPLISSYSTGPLLTATLFTLSLIIKFWKIRLQCR